MIEAATIDVWTIELLGDDTGERHRRYLVAADHREAAIAAVSHYVSTEMVVSSSTNWSGPAAVVEMRQGKVRAI
jgi:hypothetical protein